MCRTNQFPGFINVDSNRFFIPTITYDIRQPLNEVMRSYRGEAELVWLIHGIERVEFRFWEQVLDNIRELLRPGGKVLFAYPEFQTVVQYYLNNHNGYRDKWREILYGRQTHVDDYVCSPVRSYELRAMLESFGFTDFVLKQEEEPNEYNSVIECNRGELRDA